MCTMNLRELPVILENYNLKAFYRRCTYELCRRTGFYRLSENKRKRLLQESQEVFVWLPNIMTKATSKISLHETVKEETIERANDVLNGKLRFFAGQKQMCGFPPKWMKDFEYSGVHLPHWTAIRTIDARQGDIKLVWEPSRFLFTFDLARAFALTSDEQYAEAFWKAFEDWEKSNPPYYGPNWLCGQETAIRIIVWVFAASVFSSALASTRERTGLLKEAIYFHVLRVLQTRKYALSQRNNHAITEAVGLLSAAYTLADIPESKDWKKKALAQIAECIEDQFSHEGAYIQHSFNYQRFALELLVWAFLLIEQNKEEVPDEFYYVFSKSFEFLYSFVDHETGALPQYGPDDGTLLFPLTACKRRDFRPLLQVLSLLSTGSRSFPAGPWDEEAVWLFGEERLSEKRQSSSADSAFYEKSGYYVLRGPNSHLFLRAADYKTRPSQADNLHIDFWHKGTNFLFDPGTYSYNPPQSKWKVFETSFSHNVAGVVGNDQMDRVGSFMWKNWVHSALVDKWHEEDIEYIEFVQNAYKSTGFKIFQRRGVLRFSDSYWIVDNLEADKECGFFVGFNLMEEPVIKKGCLILRKGENLMMQFFPEEALAEYLWHMDEDSSLGWRAETYYQAEPRWRFERRFYGRSLKHLTFIEGISGSCSDPERHPLEVLEELQLVLQFDSRVRPMVTKRQMAK